MRERVMRCFEAGALATGATLEVEPRHEPYAEMRHDPEVAAAFRRAVTPSSAACFARPGRAGRRPGGSTDMGNVSHAIPSIHPFVGIGSLPAVNHQPEFTAHCVTPRRSRPSRQRRRPGLDGHERRRTSGAPRPSAGAADATYGGRPSYPWRFGSHAR